MQTLWSALRRRWLDPGDVDGVDHLCDHLRRDIGLSNIDGGVPSHGHIRERNLSDARTFLTLQAYR